MVLGRGPARAAAEMAALTLKEADGLAAEALESAQFRHGPLELAGPNLAAIVIATEPETETLDRALARELREVGAAVFEITRGGRPRRPRPRRRSSSGSARSTGRSRRPSPSCRSSSSPIELAVAHGREPGVVCAGGEGDDP